MSTFGCIKMFDQFTHSCTFYNIIYIITITIIIIIIIIIIINNLLLLVVALVPITVAINRGSH